MQGNEYQTLVMRTNDGRASERLECIMDTLNRFDFPDMGAVLNACLGLSGEVGEFNDMIKKWIFHEKELDIEHLKKELGDILWYAAMMCHAFNWNMNEIMQINIDKLEARFPKGFDVDKANNRKNDDV